ncbi:hypothetical protein PAE9249_05359 [Paenibacillus sp. CECT 9249]|uniref:S-layer homology domain-containing protein n=1 Tax=Paenibacillus sp. CECT 9249 TaxID=2845385 RepID=UPI001E3D9C01|nr:S-layer homology domain-containing protein [Paenibacillus sp. CECT 9249]CAH0122768.1 hypothetical protein PAE9249_05359 [Paenibacillus sp. CECT 9249]
MRRTFISLSLSLSLITMPVTVIANEHQSTYSKSAFHDVSETHWGFSAIQWGLENQIVSGYPDGSFKPDQNVTQSEFLSMLLKAYKVDIPKPTEEDTWDAPLLKYASESNWTLVDDTNKPINRGQVAKLLTNASGKNFNVRDSIHYLLDTGLSNGKTERSISGYKENDLLTRAEAIAFTRNVKTKLDVLKAAPTTEDKYNNPNSEIKDVQEVTWSPTDRQKEYATEVFKLIRYDIANQNLKVKVPSVDGKEVISGIAINDAKYQKITLNKLYEYNDVNSVKMNIQIVEEKDGGIFIVDKYDLYSKDKLPHYLEGKPGTNTEDIIVVDQYKNIVPLSVVLEALGFDSDNQNVQSDTSQESLKIPANVVEEDTAVWNPTEEQKVYGNQIFKPLTWDNETRTLSFSIPKMPSKNPLVGIQYGTKKEKIVLGKVYTFKNLPDEFKLDITIFTDETYTETDDEYTIFSYSLAKKHGWADGVPSTDLVVKDQYKNNVSLNAVYKALGINSN